MNIAQQRRTWDPLSDEVDDWKKIDMDNLLTQSLKSRLQLPDYDGSNNIFKSPVIDLGTYKKLFVFVPIYRLFEASDWIGQLD
mgnify:CR=1 FL=1